MTTTVNQVPITIGLSAVVVSVMDGEACALSVSAPDSALALPSGPFDPDHDRTFELALRAFVTAQTGFELGFVEQLYTFGDKGRDAPLADLGARSPPTRSGEPARIISVGYLALSPALGGRDEPLSASAARWTPFGHHFPWEDWREGRPSIIDEVIAPALRRWLSQNDPRLREGHASRIRTLFALDGARWNEERVLERYELLYEAGLAAEAARDRGLAASPEATTLTRLGQPMASDHRRILATGLGRLRGKLKYRPIIFDLMPPKFTLSQLQRTVESISGVALHKQNFRRMIERTELVEGLGVMDADTGGRPAELFRFRREVVAVRQPMGLSLPTLREN